MVARWSALVRGQGLVMMGGNCWLGWEGRSG